MERAVEPSQLHRLVSVEKAMEVEKMITAVVVVLVAVFPIPLIPDTFDVRKGCGLGLVHPLNQPDIHLLTVAHPLRLDL